MSTIHMKNMPKDVRKYILKVQGETKEKSGIGVFSQQSTFYKIVREHKAFMKIKANQTDAGGG